MDEDNKEDMTLKTAVVINPELRTVEIVRKAWTLREIQCAVGGGKPVYIDNAGLSDDYSVYVDDAGLLKDPENFFTVPGFVGSPLAGIGVVLGCKDGESTSLADEYILLLLFPGVVRFASAKRAVI